MKKFDAPRRAPDRPALRPLRPLRSLRPFWPLCALCLAGCAVQPPAAPVAVAIAPQWQAPLPAGSSMAALPHQGSLSQLSLWWQQQNDPLLVELIMAAEAVSPSIASARSNIEQARASRVASGAALLPTLDATASVSRSRLAPTNGAAAPITTAGQAGLQASWEIDLFGQYSASRDADQQRLVGSQALWQAARVSVAAELANQYYSLRACEKLLAVARADAASRAETARLAELSAQAGFQAPATAALARASAAEGNGNAIQQHALCDLDIKALVALTGIAETDLRQKLTQTPADAAPETMTSVVSVPAEVLAQRPDIFNAAREVDAAHAEVGSARAERYPRLSLSGSIATSKSIARGVSRRFDTWSVGPLQLTIPLFDGGASEANVEAARARYENAAAQYRGSVRQAVREVEEALVNLQSTAERNQDAVVAAEGYQASFTATQARYQGGLASLVELEDARRTQLAAQSAVVNLQRQRRSAWVALYRALGGGWTTASPAPPPLATDISSNLSSAATP
ncbi:MAG: efflux transporter outer membrane subunit [Polaromonas sp.]